MITTDRLLIRAAPARVYSLAAGVERWPEILPHYRWVTRRSGTANSPGIVEMAAWRPFGTLRWPTWWVSEMGTDAVRRRITYRHIEGITTGMDVLWTIETTDEGLSDVTIVHTWDGPDWPVIGAIAARDVIGPVFVHGIASRTLAGIGAAAERGE